VTALTLAIRVIGGSIGMAQSNLRSSNSPLTDLGYCVYYNVFINKFIPNATKYIGHTMVADLHITNKLYIHEAIVYTGASLLELLHTIPGIGMNQTAYEMVVLAGQVAYAASYKYVYYFLG
jgi:hypothetical protein